MREVSLPVFAGDTDYQAAQQFLQLGDWARALTLLELLRQRYPDDATVAQVLVQTRLRAELDMQGAVRPRRFATPRRVWGRRIGLLLALLLLGGAGIGVALRLPAMLAGTAGQGATTTAAQLDAGYELITQGRYDEAAAYFAELATRRPDDAAVLEGQRALETARELRSRYDMALQAEAAGDTATALELLQAVLVQDPGFADAARRLARLERHLAIDTWLDESVDLRALGLHELIVERLEQARTLELAYRREEVVAQLTQAYLALAQAILSADPPQPNRLPAALGYLDQALNLDTANQTAADERRWARLYLEGERFAAEQNYALAATRWRTLFDERPDYLNGALVAALYDVTLAEGDRLREAGDCAAALDQYTDALALPITDSTVALARIVELQPCLDTAPLPLPTPTP